MSDGPQRVVLIHSCRVAVAPTRILDGSNDGGFLDASTFIGPAIINLAEPLRPSDVLIVTPESTVARFCHVERASQTQILVHTRTSTGVSVTSPIAVDWYRVYFG